MFLISCSVFLSILNIFDQSEGLTPLPQVADNDILKTESIIRATTNKLFSNLKLKRPKDKPKMRDYILVHNYFVSLTLTDFNNLKEIAKLTRVDNKNSDNVTQNVMIEVNEILNNDMNFEIYKNKPNMDDVDDKIVTYIGDYFKQLDYFKRYNAAHITQEEILKLLENEDVQSMLNASAQIKPKPIDEDTLLNEHEFWNSNGRRIYDGKRTKVKHFPFVVSVHLFNKFTCAGSIIKSDLIITAASCLQLVHNNRFYRENPAFLTVRVGSTFYDGGGENVPVMEVYFHPSYDPKTLKNNLALMRLLRHIKLTRKKAKKIEVDSHAHALPLTSGRVTIVGWGAQRRSNILGSPFDNRLTYSNLDVYPLDDCRDIYSRNYVNKHNFCAGFLSKGGGACNHDVGDPGVVEGVLVGLVSFGSPVCGIPDAPTVFTKLGFYIDWIEEIADNDVPISKKRPTLKPQNKNYFPEFIDHGPTEPTTYTIEPLMDITTEIVTTIEDHSQVQELRNKQKKHDKQQLKEFLETILNDQEIEQFIGFMNNKGKKEVERKGTERERKVDETQAMKGPSELIQEPNTEPVLATVMAGEDPQTDSRTSDVDGGISLDINSETEPGEPESKIITDYGKVDDNQEKDKEKELMLDSPVGEEVADKSDKGMVSALPDETKAKGTKYVSVLNKPHPVKKLKKTRSVLRERSNVKDGSKILTHSKASAIKVEPKNNNDSTLTLLYLSDNENSNKKFKIYNGKGIKDGTNIKVYEDQKKVVNIKKDYIGLSTTAESFKDLTYRINKDERLSDLVSENLLHDILSDMINDAEKNNKTT